MAEIQWGLLNPVDVGAQLQQGFATGAALVKHGQTRSALKAYLANPDDPKALSALAYYDPQTAQSMMAQRAVQDKLQQEKWARGRQVALGELAVVDPRGAKEEALKAGDLDLAKTFGEMDDESRKRSATFWTEAAPLAFKLRQIADPEQRKALFAQARPILEAHGADPAQLDSFDPTNDTALDAVIATGQKVSDLIEQGRVTWHQQGEQPSFATDFMGRPVGTQNPAVIGAPSGGNPGGNNNPGALRKPGSLEFQTFPNEAAGIAAQEAQLGRYIQRGIRTVGDIIETYAPRKSRGGDNTDEQVNNYIAYVSKRLGIDPSAPIDPAHLSQLAGAMREFETGHRAKAVTAQHDEAGIRAAAQRAIANGADPAQVRARAAAHGVVL